MANKKSTKYNLSFWQLFSVIVIALVLGGFIYNFAYNNQLQDEINSISFIPHIIKAPVSSPAKVQKK